MLRKIVYGALLLPVLLAASCAANKGDVTAPSVSNRPSLTEGEGRNRPGRAASMEQLYAENGRAVSTRKLEAEDFSVYLKYPTVIYASSESSAYSGLNDVVRTVSAKVGDTVREDAVIISLSPDNQSLRQAALSYENAESAFSRAEALFRNNDIARQDFDTARTRYEIAKAAFKAARDMVYVKAPITGTITRINVHTTENVQPGTPLFTVSSRNGFEARFYVGSDEIDRITTGARVFINEGAKKIEGRVTQVSLIMDSGKQAFPVSAFFDGKNQKLASGMGVDIAVETYHNEKAIVLSRKELLQTEEGYTAFVVAGEFPRQVAVQTGQERGLTIEIASGLSEGDMLICDGLARLTPDTKLNITELDTTPLLSLVKER